MSFFLYFYNIIFTSPLLQGVFLLPEIFSCISDFHGLLLLLLLLYATLLFLAIEKESKWKGNVLIKRKLQL